MEVTLSEPKKISKPYSQKRLGMTYICKSFSLEENTVLLDFMI
jgi:hypothetical protein